MAALVETLLYQAILMHNMEDTMPITILPCERFVLIVRHRDGLSLLDPCFRLYKRGRNDIACGPELLKLAV